jgi:methanogenic corrinoid protein MtbC1
VEGKSPAPDKGTSLDRKIYNDATAKIRDLKSRLPEGAVTSLAEEVLRRTAELASVRAAGKKIEVQPGEIQALTDALVGADPEGALRRIQALQDSGTNLEEIYVIYLSAAAQRLGAMWEDSSLTIAQVTLGTSRIYGILRALDPIRKAERKPNEKAVVFATVPGDTHVLGVRMAADIFRQRGWDIELLIGLSHDELIAHLDESTHLIIGLSAGGARVFAELARLVRAIRLHKPGVLIFVGGQAVAQNADLVAAVSPDGMAPDFESAYDVMMSMWRDATKDAAAD